MVMGGGSCSKGREYIFHIPICCKNFNVCLKKTKINEKEAGVGPFLKKECGSGDGGQLTRNISDESGSNTDGVNFCYCFVDEKVM